MEEIRCRYCGGNRDKNLKKICPVCNARYFINAYYTKSEIRGIKFRGVILLIETLSIIGFLAFYYISTQSVF